LLLRYVICLHLLEDFVGAPVDLLKSLQSLKACVVVHFTELGEAVFEELLVLADQETKAASMERVVLLDQIVRGLLLKIEARVQRVCRV
jgi:hypothetical protein